MRLPSRQDATLGHVVPLFALLALFPLASLVRVENTDLPWWHSWPEFWVYPLQAVVCLALIAWWWPCYQFRPVTARGLAIGVAGGLLGAVLWLLPDHLGWQNHGTKGFNPSVLEGHPAGYWATLVLRFLRACVAVPFVEEVFWRGFLWRWIASDQSPDWPRLPVFPAKWKAMGLTCLGMMIAHNPIDYPLALLWSALAFGVLLTTRSMAACIVCHAVTNLAMGLYVMQTGKWGFW